MYTLLLIVKRYSMAFFDFFGQDIGGYTGGGTANAGAAGYSGGQGVPNTGITWGQFLRSMQAGGSGNRSQQQGIQSLQSPQQPVSNAPMYSVGGSDLPQIQRGKQTDTQEIMSILGALFGGGAGGMAAGAASTGAAGGASAAFSPSVMM